MSQTDIISISLGAISVVLGVLAIWQSRRYKNLVDKTDKDREQVLNEIREKSGITIVKLRNIDAKIPSSTRIISLHKDELQVRKNSKYNKRNKSQIINELKDDLPQYLKKSDVNLIKKFLNNESSPESVKVSLRHEYDVDDLENIKILSNKYYGKGVSFEILFQ